MSGLFGGLGTDTQTIASIATPPGMGAVAVIRLSGSRAWSIARRLFRDRRRADLPCAPRRGMRVGVIVDPAAETVLDQCLLLAMPAPGSYTGEDVVEIQCHGGQLVAERVLELCLGQGARLAGPGEFTLRAYQNAKMDLTQAEAVANLVAAETAEALRLAAAQVEGTLGGQLAEWRQRTAALAASVEAAIDFPDDDHPLPDYATLRGGFAEVEGGLRDLLATAVRGRRLTSGVRLVIAGKPNVGKSSVFNRLLGRPRAIVTAMAGTTRDLVEDVVSMGGVPVRLQDTAGVRSGAGPVETIGIEVAQRAIGEADLVLAVLDAGSLPDDDDRRALAATRGAECLIVLNKIDTLWHPLEASSFLSTLGMPPTTSVVGVSALTGEGWAGLVDALTALAAGPGSLARSAAVLTTARQEREVSRALGGLRRSGAALRRGLPPDVALLGVYEALEALADATGRGAGTARDEVLQEVFSRFCVGK